LNGFVNEFFNEFPTAVGKTVREEVLNNPPVNIEETPDDYLVRILAPGYLKSDFKVSLDNHLLTISSEKREEEVAEANKLIRKEFSQRSFKRSFTINEKIEAENITAKYDNGILYLTLPKRETAKAFSKDIEIL
jgi:HSP20 family protein